VSQIRRA